MPRDITQMNAHELAAADPRELVWAAANAASTALDRADSLATAAKFVADCPEVDRTRAIENVLNIAIARYVQARRGRP